MIYYKNTLCTAKNRNLCATGAKLHVKNLPHMDFLHCLQYKLSRPGQTPMEPGRRSDSGYHIRGTVVANITEYVGVFFLENLPIYSLTKISN